MGSVVAVSCAFPELSTSPDWRGGGETEAGAPADAGRGGTDDNRGGEAFGGSDAGGAGGEPGGVGEGGEGGEHVTPGPDIIRATVVDLNGEPLAGVPVLIDDLLLETDERGQIETPGEGRSSFRATVIATEARQAFVYDGVTRRDLHVPLNTNAVQPETGVIRGTVTTPVDAQNLALSFVAGTSSYSGMREPTDTAPQVRYEFSLAWWGATLEGRVQGLNWTNQPGANVPDSFYFGSTPASLAPNGDVQGIDFELAAISARQVTVTISTPAGATRNDFWMLGGFSIPHFAPTTETVDYAIPDDADFDEYNPRQQFLSTCNFTGGANASVIVAVGADDDSIEDACPEPPALSAPANEASGLSPAARLSFSPKQAGCNGVNAVLLGASWTITAWTTASAVVLPDLSPWNVDYDEQEVQWSASTVTPCESIDAFVTKASEGAATESPRTTFARSENRTFVTAP